MRGDRREQVPAVEGRRDRLEPEGRAGELDGLERSSEPIERAGEQPVVGADEEAPLGGGDGHRPPLRADPRVDDRKVDAGRTGGQGVGERDGALADVLSGDPVGEVDQRRAGGDL